MHTNKRKTTTGTSLVGVMVACAIVILAVLFFTTGGGKMLGGNQMSERPDGKGETIIGRSLLKADDSVCQQQLGQLRTAISIATDPVEGTRPATLQETRLGQQFYKCPIDQTPYQYNPETGKVHCPHPGHESF